MAEKVEIIVQATDAASSVFEGIGGAGIALAGVVAAVGAALAVTVGALADFVNTAAEAEEVTARFDVLVGNSNLAGYTDEMYTLADSLSAVTRFDDEAILGAEAMLSTFDTIGQDIFPRVTAAALDLAEATGGDATSGAQTLGRAFADIEGGSLGALRGVAKLTDAQKAAAEEIAKTNGDAAAQAYVLDILDSKFGGLAENMGGTFSGQMKIFQNTIDNVKESLGAKLLPVLTPLIAKFTDLALQVMPMLGSVMDKYVVPIVNLLVDNIGYFVDLLISGMNPLQAFTTMLSAVTDINLSGVGQSLTNFAGGVVNFFTEAAKGVLDFVSNTWDGIVEFFSQMITAIQPGLNSFKQFWDENGQEIEKIVSDSFAKIGLIFVELASKVIPFLVNKFNELGKWFSENGPLITRMVKFFADEWVGTTAAVSGAWSFIEPMLNGMISGFLLLGKAVMQVLTGDISGAMTTWVSALGNAFTTIYNTFIGFANWITSFFGTTWAVVSAQWGAFFAGVGNLAVQFISNFQTLFNNIPKYIATVLLVLRNAFAVWFGAQLISWRANWQSFQVSVQSVFDGIMTGISDKLRSINDLVSGFIAGLVNQFNNTLQSFVDFGASIVANITSGISGAWGTLESIVTNLVGDLIAAIKGMFGLGSTTLTTNAGIENIQLAGVGENFTPISGRVRQVPVTTQNVTTQQTRQNTGPTKVVNNFLGPITLKIKQDSDFLSAR